MLKALVAASPFTQTATMREVIREAVIHTVGFFFYLPSRPVAEFSHNPVLFS